MNINMSEISLPHKITHTAVLLLAHGAPTRLQDIPEYLKNIRGGRVSSPEVIQEITDRYEQIGGGSPLLDITRSQAAALQKFLNQDGDDFKVYLGMRAWAPFIQETVQQMVADGVQRIVALCLAPQYSRWSTERYMKSFSDALAQSGLWDIEIQFVKSWPDQPRLIDAFVERYQAAADRLRAEGREDFHTLFTVHSIPSSSVEQEGDPYVQEYEKTLHSILEQANISRWHQAYQSQGMIPVPWLEPSVETTIDKIADAGGTTILMVPVGFVCDHVEILYDIDIAFKKHAAQRNIELRRVESLNDSPLFIEALASVVWEHLV